MNVTVDKNRYKIFLDQASMYVRHPLSDMFSYSVQLNVPRKPQKQGMKAVAHFSIVIPEIETLSLDAEVLPSHYG